MNNIITLEEKIRKNHQANWELFLGIQKDFVEQNFDWINLKVDKKNKLLPGKEDLNLDNRNFSFLLSYCPFYNYRYDRIYMVDNKLKYHRDIHVYGDLSLCIYHPLIDQGPLQKFPLVKMIPWINEWIVFYLQWKKYGVWLGKAMLLS